MIQSLSWICSALTSQQEQRCSTSSCFKRRSNSGTKESDPTHYPKATSLFSFESVQIDWKLIWKNVSTDHRLAVSQEFGRRAEK